MNKIELKPFNDFKNDEFRQLFKKYFEEEEGIVLNPNTTVFDQMQQKANEGKEHAFIITKNSKIVAFILSRIYSLKNSGKFLFQNIGYIEELYVLPEERNQKFATKLICETYKYFAQNNIKRVILTTEEHNYNFYKKLGYKLDETYECANKLKVFAKDLEKKDLL